MGCRAWAERPTGVLGVGDEYSRWIKFVAGLGSENGWRSDMAGRYMKEGGPVRGVKAAGEAAEDFQVGVCERLGDDGLGLGMASFSFPGLETWRAWRGWSDIRVLRLWTGVSRREHACSLSWL